jgi:SulP family sulfate permease
MTEALRVPESGGATLGRAVREVTAGSIVGLSAVIYSLSYGALLFSGPLAPYVGYGISIALITAVFGALFGLLSEEKAFISGPDSNTISVHASMFAIMGTTAGVLTLDLAVATVFTTTTLAAIIFLVVGRGRLSAAVRYIPFSVMAGFLVSGGWLMSSGSLDIISGTPLSLKGVRTFLADPVRPELAVGIAVALTFFFLSKRIPNSVLIPAVMLVTTLGVHVLLESGLCTGPRCGVETWRFANTQDLQWMAPWEIELDLAQLDLLVAQLPTMLVITFVGVLTILLSVPSLELTFQKEFDLNRVLRGQALMAGLAAAFGGYIGIITIGRTMLNRQTGGKAVAGIIAAGICLATLLGAGGAIFYIPKAALGGLVLYLGITMLKQWLWDRRKFISWPEYLQIFLILVLVANYGFVTGFAAGLLISCVLFVVTYSRIPLAHLATNLAVFPSSVVRPDHETQVLSAHGAKTYVYRLSGYVFFGSASKIEGVFKGMDRDIEAAVIDFTNVSGVDSSAISVFQRIFRRYWGRATLFGIVYSPGTETAIKSFSPEPGAGANIRYFPSLDHALEWAEEAVLHRWEAAGEHDSTFEFLENLDDREVFRRHCELRHIRKGEKLSAEGDHVQEIYFIESGALDVVKAHVRLAKLHQGAIVGEMALYTNEARTASIIAAADSSVYVFHKEALTRLRTTHPGLATQFDLMVIGKISGALKRTSKLVAMFR